MGSGALVDAAARSEEFPPEDVQTWLAGRGAGDTSPDEGEALEQSLEEVQLLAEIRSIEMDSSILELRRMLERQEYFIEEWTRGMDRRRDQDTAGGLVEPPLERSEDEKREDAQYKAALVEARKKVESMRQQLELLERQRREMSPLGEAPITDTVAAVAA
eukprot:TRINITY_DN24835_c0_g1_i1.p1 TRINITY_DN24835_c0_g1~~TRINITY_DN24835_c0_g1_i1.p1  ORF type:complete len:185 (+),score=31.51 TRINITY_DN24835_c0_g1_i1:76-555(+)